VLSGFNARTKDVKANAIAVTRRLARTRPDEWRHDNAPLDVAALELKFNSAAIEQGATAEANNLRTVSGLLVEAERLLRLLLPTVESGTYLLSADDQDDVVTMIRSLVVAALAANDGRYQRLAIAKTAAKDKQLARARLATLEEAIGTGGAPRTARETAEQTATLKWLSLHGERGAREQARSAEAEAARAKHNKKSKMGRTAGGIQFKNDIKSDPRDKDGTSPDDVLKAGGGETHKEVKAKPTRGEKRADKTK
jgi:hypothetical protein